MLFFIKKFFKLKLIINYFNNITIKQLQGNLYTYKNKLLTELINILKQINHTSKIYNELLRRVKNKLLIQLNNNIDDCIF